MRGQNIFFKTYSLDFGAIGPGILFILYYTGNTIQHYTLYLQ